MFPIAVSPELLKYSADEIERSYANLIPPEAIRMYLSIVKGEPMGPGSGWYGPAESRYAWGWLAEHHGIAQSAA